MKGKIVQNGTGYAVGEVDGDKVSIHRDLWSDPVLNAHIAWEGNTYLVCTINIQTCEPLFFLKNSVQEVRDLLEGSNNVRVIYVIELSGDVKILDILEPFSNSISLKRARGFDYIYKK